MMFFDDYALYIQLLTESCQKYGTEVWGYCLMTNHVHLIMLPSSEDGLRSSLGEAHRRYTLHINRQEGCRGHLWQERFHSFPMDERYLLCAMRYVELNPVHADMVKRAKAHLMGQDDKLVKVAPMLDRVANWQDFLDSDLDDATIEAMRKHTKTGRPLGDDAFLDGLEQKFGKVLRPLKRGRKRMGDK